MTPKRFIRANAHLPVRSLRETLDYYRDALGFYEEWTWTNEAGKVTDGGIRRDELRLLFAEDDDFVQVINGDPKRRLAIIWFVDNIDEIYSEFRNRKIDICDPLRMHPYGLREFAFVDINGYYVRVSEKADNGQT